MRASHALLACALAAAAVGAVAAGACADTRAFPADGSKLEPVCVGSLHPPPGRRWWAWEALVRADAHHPRARAA